MIDAERTDVIWWPADPEDGVAEKPIAIGVYVGTMTLRQGDRGLLIMTDQLEEFVKALRMAARKGPRK